jgi:hypothetical protein
LNLPMPRLNITTQKIQAVAAAISKETQNVEIKDSVVRCLALWMRKWPNDSWQTLSVEKQFAVRLNDLRGRPFWFVGKRDYDGLDHVCPFLGEYKTHRGPWMRKMTVDKMLEEWFESWKLNLQSAMYLHAMEHQYGPLSHLRYLVRCVIKPGPYNSEDAREKWLSYDRLVHQSLVDSFIGRVTQINDSLESNNWPKTDTACINRYKKQCAYWGICKGGAPTEQLEPYTPHLTHLDALTPVLPWYDVSSVRLYQECPHKWYQQHILRLAQKRSLALEEGSAFHSGIETLYS